MSPTAKSARSLPRLVGAGACAIPTDHVVRVSTNNPSFCRNTATRRAIWPTLTGVDSGRFLTLSRAFRYDPRRELPYVGFTKVRTYRFGVPDFVCHALLRANSKGRYFKEIARARYNFEEVA